MGEHRRQPSNTAKQWADLGERAAWTLLQAGFGYQVAELLNLPGVWGVLLASALSVAKTALAQRVGAGTGATLPARYEPLQAR
jgi:hypothetical protein